MEQTRLADCQDDEIVAAVEAARASREEAYAPYSEYVVGAAVVTADSSRFTGHNIENVNYTNSAHAEQVALHQAVQAGYREPSEYRFLVVTSKPEDADEPEGSPPCGLCRQSLTEFCAPDFRVIVDGGEYIRTYRLEELLPEGMSGESLEAGR
jgi:cytidine deaminase